MFTACDGTGAETLRNSTSGCHICGGGMKVGELTVHQCNTKESTKHKSNGNTEDKVIAVY